MYFFKQHTYTPKIIAFDLADTEGVGKAAEEILACYGQVDVLINNAGIDQLPWKHSGYSSVSSAGCHGNKLLWAYCSYSRSVRTPELLCLK